MNLYDDELIMINFLMIIDKVIFVIYITDCPQVVSAYLTHPCFVYWFVNAPLRQQYGGTNS